MRHSGSYLCRYRGCPRTTQGFISSDIRQRHESSHTPRFRCTNPTCGFFGRALKNRAAINKHAIKYHGDDDLTTIPTSLRKASTLPQNDRSRFLLKESSSASRNLSFQAGEEGKILSGVDVAFDPASKIQNIGISQPTSTEIEAEIMRELEGQPTPIGWQQKFPLRNRIATIQKMYVSAHVDCEDFINISSPRKSDLLRSNPEYDVFETFHTVMSFEKGLFKQSSDTVCYLHDSRFIS